MMKIEILELVDGARNASGTAVIIDVFRAFSLEPFVLSQNAGSLTAVGETETAYAAKQADPNTILIGERHGRILPGFDYGNSPAAVNGVDFTGRDVIHTTSAGTQGLTCASHAKRIFAASLVNAKATAEVIRASGTQYIQSLLEGSPMTDIRKRAEDLRYYEGKKFFDPAQADVFPEPDFWLCVDPDRFDFAIEAILCDNGFRMKAVKAV